jgi:hypothetical protein
MGVLRVDSRTGAVLGRTARFVITPQALWREVVRMKMLSPIEHMVLQGLSSFVQFRTNALADHGHPLTVAEMARTLEMDEANMRRYVRALVKKNALGKWSSGMNEEYVMNPALYRAGHVDPAIVTLFDEQRNKYRAMGRMPLRVHGRSTNLVP